MAPSAPKTASSNSLFDSISGREQLKISNLFNVEGWVAVGECDISFTRSKVWRESCVIGERHS